VTQTSINITDSSLLSVPFIAVKACWDTNQLCAVSETYCSVHVSVFYVYGSVHRWSIAITVQRDATQSSLLIILHVYGSVHRWSIAITVQRDATQSSLFIILHFYGSVHRWSISITVQRDSTQSSLFIILHVYGSVHRWSMPITVQRDSTQSSLLFCKFTLHVSGVNHTHHQEYTKLELQPPVLVIFFVHLPPSNVVTLGHVGGR